MSFPNMQLTDAGRAIIVKALTGSEYGINFTKIQVGNGDEPSDIGALTVLQNPLVDVSITEITTDEGIALLTGQFDNSELDTGFSWTELGVYADDADAGEVLYAYAYAGDSAEYIPAYSGTCYLKTDLNIAVVVGDAENITATIGEYSGFANKEDFEAHIEDYDNPHKVTAEQVGLGDVENVAPSDATITFDDTATTVSELTSGETTASLFSKIKAAISALITHLKASNPHGITYSSIGAAASSHTHSATEITSGTLGVARGGTGKSSFTANRLVYPSASTTLSQLAFPSSYGYSLKQDSSGAPYWGPSVGAGSYVGTGTYGSSNQNVLTFTRCPKFILITSSGSSGVLIFISPSAAYNDAANATYGHALYTRPSQYSDMGMYTLGTTITGPSSNGASTWAVTWYSTTNATLQGNVEDITYWYTVWY